MRKVDTRFERRIFLTILDFWEDRTFRDGPDEQEIDSSLPSARQRMGSADEALLEQGVLVKGAADA
jgi:hypothetical protein